METLSTSLLTKRLFSKLKSLSEISFKKECSYNKDLILIELALIHELILGTVLELRPSSKDEEYQSTISMLMTNLILELQ